MHDSPSRRALASGGPHGYRLTMTTILLSAGGTGGHLFPAEALAHELIARGYAVHLVTDDRAGRFAERFPVTEVHRVRSATFASKNPVAVFSALWTLWRGFREAGALIAQDPPGGGRRLRRLSDRAAADGGAARRAPDA